MNFIEQIEDIISSNKEWARGRAEAAKAIRQQYEKGNLSNSEYQELLEDLIRTERLDRDADDTDLRNNLVAGIRGLLNLI